MSNVPPNGLLKAELEYVKAINKELLAACEAALGWAELNKQRAGTLEVDRIRSAIAKAKAS